MWTKSHHDAIYTQSWKPLSLLKLIFKAPGFWQKPKFDIFQKALLLTVVSSTKLVLEAAQIQAIQYLSKFYTFFYKKLITSGVLMDFQRSMHCMKCARIRVLTDPYSPVLRTESMILSWYGRMWVSENPHSRIFCAVKTNLSKNLGQNM